MNATELNTHRTQQERIEQWRTGKLTANHSATRKVEMDYATALGALGYRKDDEVDVDYIDIEYLRAEYRRLLEAYITSPETPLPMFYLRQLIRTADEMNNRLEEMNTPTP
jgi:hypothetical protein